MRIRLISLILAVAVCVTVSTLNGASMVPGNVLGRVFALRIGDKRATGFVVEADGRQYLITVRHFVTPASDPLVVGILRDTEWIGVPFRVIPVEPASVDIAVLAPPQRLSLADPVLCDFDGSILSQEVFFLGYGLNLSIDGRALNNGFPFPLVKHGIIAAFNFTRGEPFLLDAINNPGFSGGPVVRMDTGNKPVIIGVVSGYRALQEPVFQGEAQTSLSVQANTGLLAAYSIRYALDAIAKKPIGAPLTPVSTQTPTK